MNSAGLSRLSTRRQSGVIIYRKVVSAEETSVLVSWALAMRPHLNNNGASRTFLKTDELPVVPDAYHAVRERVESLLGLRGMQKEPMFGWYLSVISSGGAVHSHLDPPNEGLHHLRCNVFLQLPTEGGMPIIGGQVYEVSVGDMLAFFPSDRWHRSEAVDGFLDRIIISFGYLAPSDFRLAPKIAGSK